MMHSVKCTFCSLIYVLYEEWLIVVYVSFDDVCVDSLQFFTTFWSLSMYDLHVPSTAYDKQIQQHKLHITVEDDKDVVFIIFLSSV